MIVAMIFPYVIIDVGGVAIMILDRNYVVPIRDSLAFAKKSMDFTNFSDAELDVLGSRNSDGVRERCAIQKKSSMYELINKGSISE